MAQNIHPTACIAPDVVLGDAVTVGPFAVIESGVEMGENCEIGAHAVVHGRVKMGSGNILHPHAVLGGLPQDTSFKAETVSWLIIGDNNNFREGFTAHRSSKENGTTRIGSGCYFMNNSHVAHDCSIGSNTIFANNVAIGGHVEVGNNVFMGGAVVVHQFCRIGSFAIVQGTTGLNMDVMPFMLIGGRPARHYKLNSVGLRRAGITGDRYKVLSAAFRLLKNKQSLEELEETEELRQLKDWLAVKSKRGTHGFIEVSG
ncbi:acyl-ACP--UDP-N-acetylglucosamine O-acyltransferase [Methylobacter sp. S3L5C]|uniref:acyl-ACP--UDP-N-acetylglucosamine O-acyltransferase n=1 Tax=Methylobacter sp. S3L5C TaxID=2839024 RepID=UPI001FABB659|nr:acyl-ACP--UDP-N-acetylglucosamine O-acyltransferase [Methylobacter sp. S3L5C]UOA08164.1 acyl-ACP--UDP-N-acetylglucosamine O-acyltransferase [Methylobacter sp. S3L5C]